MNILGLDFGSDSVRAIVVNAQDGQLLADDKSEYPRWSNGKYSDSSQYMERQHPLDYIESMESVISSVLLKIGKDNTSKIKALGLVTTGSTPCPIDKNGVPLALLDGFTNNPNAMFHLWKDHTAIEQADILDRALKKAKIDYTKYQGKYSSEWFWAKIFHTSLADDTVFDNAYTWVEHCDWMTALLTGNTKPAKIRRNACAAGHKALWNSHWGGLPDRKTLADIHPSLAKVWDSFPKRVWPCTSQIGYLSEEWSKRFGLPYKIIISGSSFDAHGGAVGAGVRERTVVYSIGTSAVGMTIANKNLLPSRNLLRYCGLAEDSVIPGFFGLETGQSAFGDAYAWLKKLLMRPLNQLNLKDANLLHNLTLYDDALLPLLLDEITNLSPVDCPDAIDWFNGRRYPDNDDRLSAGFYGVTLDTNASQLFYSIVMATIFGMKRIMDGIEQEIGLMDNFIAIGGIPLKAPQIMQILADITQKKIIVPKNEQTGALGAVLYAAVAAGFYDNLFNAQDAICTKEQLTYYPQILNKNDYGKAFTRYIALADTLENHDKTFFR